MGTVNSEKGLELVNLTDVPRIAYFLREQELLLPDIVIPNGEFFVFARELLEWNNVPFSQKPAHLWADSQQPVHLWTDDGLYDTIVSQVRSGSIPLRELTVIDLFSKGTGLALIPEIVNGIIRDGTSPVSAEMKSQGNKRLEQELREWESSPSHLYHHDWNIGLL